MELELELETLDFGEFIHGSEAQRKALAKRLVNSLTQHGFTKLINHGVPDDVVDGIWHWVSSQRYPIVYSPTDILLQGKKLFSLTPEQKAKFAHLPSPEPQRGWSHIGAEVTSRLQERNFTDASKTQTLKDEKVLQLLTSRSFS